MCTGVIIDMLPELCLIGMRADVAIDVSVVVMLGVGVDMLADVEIIVVTAVVIGAIIGGAPDIGAGVNASGLIVMMAALEFA